MTITEQGPIVFDPFNYAFQEDPDPVCPLHGFPDTAWTWRYLGPFLAERGYRVAAPFLRGHGPSSVPTTRPTPSAR